MAQPLDGRVAHRAGAAPSAVSMAVLCPHEREGDQCGSRRGCVGPRDPHRHECGHDLQWRHLALYGLLSACALGAASAPASVAVHMTMLREDAGRPIRPVGDILLWGTLALSVEFTACLALL